MNFRLGILFYICVSFISCLTFSQTEKIVTGAQTLTYIDMLKGKRVGVVANQTSVIADVHLVDTLRELGIEVRAIYCPEHGFRGTAEAGALIQSGVDEKTGLPVISLYGKNKKPQKDEFKQNDIIVFDIQDVGCRFYTYISTLHYVMEACAENNIPLIVLDRPNPNGHYVDGPVLKDTSLVSFVGMHPVPIVHGMTIGEYALMINGQYWLGTSNKRVVGEKGSLRCELKVIEMLNYTHDTYYKLPIYPSPNLRTMYAINIYPSICWFEGTPVSLGRGTDIPFEVIGYPEYKKDAYAFTPRAIKGVSDNPPYKGKECFGIKISPYNILPKEINLDYLRDMYENYPNKDKFFQPFFDKLAGSKELKNQIRQRKSDKEIKASWDKDLNEYKQIREKYLLYN